MSNRVLSLVKVVFTFALNRGLLAAHPATGLRPPGVEHARDRVLTDAELRALWATWSMMGYAFGTAFQLLLLTAVRPGELGGMRWDEVNFDTSVWTIPGARMKAGVPTKCRWRRSRGSCSPPCRAPMGYRTSSRRGRGSP